VDEPDLMHVVSDATGTHPGTGQEPRLVARQPDANSRSASRSPGPCTPDGPERPQPRIGLRGRAEYCAPRKLRDPANERL
jgi:hypothetical protein